MIGVLRQAGRWQSAARASGSTSSHYAWLRAMHSSQPLDPTPAQPEPVLDDAITYNAAHAPSAQASQLDTNMEQFIGQDCVHVKLSYLHSSTKDAAKIPRAGDISRGYNRAEPHYVPLSSHIFDQHPRRDILHSAVVYYLDGLRNGTASTKTRGEVNFSGRKIRPQKGTGNARLGTRGSPLLRKGGVAHGPKPRDMSTKLNRRVREQALRSALSLRWRNGDLHVVKSLFWQPPPQSCGPLDKLLKTRQWDDTLFLTAPRHPEPADPARIGRTGKPSSADPVYTNEQRRDHGEAIRNFAIALGNIQRTEMVRLDTLTEEAHQEARKAADRKKPGELHAYEVLARKKLVCDLGAIEWLEEKLGGALFHDFERLALDESPSISELNPSQVLTGEDQQVRQAEDEAIENETDRVLREVPPSSASTQEEKPRAT